MIAMGLRGLALAAALAATGVVATPDAHAAEPAPVSAMRVDIVDRTAVAEAFPGVIAPRRESRLGFETGGLVASVTADVGDTVEAGAELARLDLRTLDAQIAAAKASLAEARASVKLARLTADRQRALAERDAASAQRVDEADANVAIAEAREAGAQATLVQLEVRRDLSILSAPYAGVVTNRYLDDGAIAGPGSPVFDLVETGALEVRVGLPRARAAELVAGDVYEFTLRDRRVDGTLRATTGVVDRATQTVTAVFDLTDATSGAGAVAAGEVARLTLDVPVEATGFWAPLTALAEGRRGLWNLYALSPPDEDGVRRVEKRLVDVVYTVADRAFVRGAVADGDDIIVSGLDRVVPGQPVTPVYDGPGAAYAGIE